MGDVDDLLKKYRANAAAYAVAYARGRGDDAHDYGERLAEVGRAIVAEVTERDVELATLRAGLARVTEERDALQRTMRILAESAVDTEEKLTAQVRALLTVVRAAVAWQGRQGDAGALRDILTDRVVALDPKMLVEEPSE